MMLRPFAGALGVGLVMILGACGNESTNSSQGANGDSGSKGTGGGANPGVGGASQNGASGDEFTGTGGMSTASDSGSAGGGIVAHDGALASEAPRPSAGL